MLVAIPITTDELGTICNALRLLAVDTPTVAATHRQEEIGDLRLLAEQLEIRWVEAVWKSGVLEPSSAKTKLPSRVSPTRLSTCKRHRAGRL